MKKNSLDQENNNFKNAEVQTESQDKEELTETINIDEENKNKLTESVTMKGFSISFTSSLILLLIILTTSIAFILLTQK